MTSTTRRTDAPGEVDLVAELQRLSALPEPDRWVSPTEGQGEDALAPMWDSDVANVIAWAGGVEVRPGGFRDDLDDLEHYALAIMAAVRYARRFAARSPSQSGGAS